jgi:DNA-directed RNA polymerase specialized sigma24 family protein
MTDADLDPPGPAGGCAGVPPALERRAEAAWRTVRVLLADRGAAEDALREAWVDAWRGVSRFQGDHPFRPWLLRVVVNCCRMGARRRILSAHPLLLEDAESPMETLPRREDDAELHAVLAALPAD